MAGALDLHQPINTYNANIQSVPQLLMLGWLVPCTCVFVEPRHVPEHGIDLKAVLLHARPLLYVPQVVVHMLHICLK